MLNSDYRRLVTVELPFKNRQMYMHSFDLSAPHMAQGFEDYLNPVLVLCRAAGATTGMAHMTVDEKLIPAGGTQRRPHPHVDGCFVRHTWEHPTPAWLHHCNRVPVDRMSVIVVASTVGCRAWRGHFKGTPANDGDCRHLAPQLRNGELLPPNTGFLLSPDCVHESLPFTAATPRTFLRIALPVELNKRIW